MSIFDFTDYKVFLKAKINENASVFGYKGKLAGAANCQRAYLSQVLTSQVHFTPDHAAGLVSFWGLPAAERDYFLEMVNLARAGTEVLRRIIQDRMNSLKAGANTVSGRIKRPKIETMKFQTKYYSVWYFSAIHILLTVSKFQTPEALSERLELPRALVMDALSVLTEARLVEREGNFWKAVSFDLHLPEQSPMTSNNHFNWRNKAVQNAQDPKAGGVHFTGVYSLSQKDYQKIRKTILEVLSESRDVALASPQEDVYSLCCDFFRV